MHALCSHRALLGLGSNLGDRASNLSEAIAQLRAHEAITWEATSTFHETTPMYYLEQPTFVNACASIRTTLSPEELLEALLAIELDMGRTRGDIDKGPRVIDLDLLLYEDRIIDTERLTLPHPGMLERPFVLEPLAEIAAEVSHPQTRRTIEDHLAELRGGVAD